ncbi:MAG: orotate phosphoribosyltransferase [Campylobacteraceae bacterium]|nr:orotate phosphoribosyltransferase [Campylobacteraceae bacterium]
MDLESIYKETGAYLEGHFLLSSGMHSQFYLQSAKVLENPDLAQRLALALAKQINSYGLSVDTVCAPAIGGILAGYALASALNVRFIFTERVNGDMDLRRGFTVSPGERVLICEDIITTGGSALEAAACIEAAGAKVVGFAALANRGFCKRVGSEKERKPSCKLPNNNPFFALGDFDFEIYEPKNCPLCAKGTKAFKPGSRNN